MATAGQAPQGPPQPPVDLSQVQGLGDPTAHPGMPVTAGANSGPGPGMDALGMSAPQADPGDITHMRVLLPTLELAANLPNSSFDFRQFVRRLRAMG